jgi:hypothetical protein
LRDEYDPGDSQKHIDQYIDDLVVIPNYYFKTEADARIVTEDLMITFMVVDKETAKYRRILKRLANFKKEILEANQQNNGTANNDDDSDDEEDLNEIYFPYLPRFDKEEFKKEDCPINVNNYEEMFDDLQLHSIPVHHYAGFRTKCINFYIDGSYEMGESYFNIIDGKCELYNPSDFKRQYNTENNNHNQYDLPATITFANKGKYEGESKFKIMHGEGTMTWTNGEKYVGEWFGGYKHGIGKYEWPNGDVYEGEFQLNMMWGTGKLTLGSGEEYDGEFFKGDFVEAQ